MGQIKNIKLHIVTDIKVQNQTNSFIMEGSVMFVLAAVLVLVVSAQQPVDDKPEVAAATTKKPEPPAPETTPAPTPAPKPTPLECFKALAKCQKAAFPDFKKMAQCMKDLVKCLHG